MSFQVGKLYFQPTQMGIIQITKRTNHMLYYKKYMSDDKPRRRKIRLTTNAEYIEDIDETFFGYMEFDKFRICHERHMRREFIKILNELVDEKKIMEWIDDRNDEYTFHIKFFGGLRGELFGKNTFHQICYEKEILFF